MRPGRTILTATAVALVAVALSAGMHATAAPAADPAVRPARTTTGPVPPASVKAPIVARGATTGGGETVIAGVPAYAWRDGCAPTSVGMILGYYDGHGFPALVDGDASSQSGNAAVSQMIASHGTAADPRHYEDYALLENKEGLLIGTGVYLYY